jgi:hypothetical protein
MERWKEAEGVWHEAAAVYQRAVGANKLAVANARIHAGYAMSMQGRHDEAVALIREVLRTYDSLTPASSPVAILARVRLGDALSRQGKFVEAESILVASYNALNQPSRMARANQQFAAQSLVRLYEAQGRSAEAAKYRRSPAP